MMLPQFFQPPADIANYADSGESSASFLASSAEWGAIKSRLASGDWALIQFGHNDKTTTTADFPAIGRPPVRLNRAAVLYNFPEAVGQHARAPCRLRHRRSAVRR